MATLSSIGNRDMGIIVKEHCAALWAAVDAEGDDRKRGYAAARRFPVPCFMGPPGEGKSATIESALDEVCDAWYTFRASDSQPSDLGGWDIPSKDDDGRLIMVNHSPDWIPTDDSARIGILFDEIGQCPNAIQNCLTQLFRDRQLKRTRLGNRVVMIAAGNRAADKAGSVNLHTALGSRVIRYSVTSRLSEWQDWALANGVDASCRSYLQWKPEHFQTFDPTQPDEPFACPRSWEYVSSAMGAYGNSARQLAAIEGLVGSGVAASYWAHRRVYSGLPSWADVQADPTGVDVPTDAEPGACFAMSALIGDAVKGLPADQAEPALVYADRFKKEEYKVFILIQCVGATDGTILQSATGRDFMTRYRDIIIDATAASAKTSGKGGAS